ncbi:hypothetical protein [Streptomyces corynorhini]|uniref:Uncharacterized protein n=1 Tax=Streptomyces corynorhini TaxID=2282652 RepID=A0A370BER0_9ACTN|nr:hypothetical protein [Streptomyces corynorhini]RDG40131.1 hypothetical protein DVH02_00265 [Streptomyces corynorhini]
MILLCNFLISRSLNPVELAAGLADAVRLTPGHVDVRHTDSDQTDRDWEAAVLCTYHPVRGDVALSLDLQVRPEALAPGAPASEPSLAAEFARTTGAAVLFPDDRIDPETYWLADPGAPDPLAAAAVRARLVASDEESPVYTVDAVEVPVAAFPRAEVGPLPEILRAEPLPTPVVTAVGSESPAAVSLRVWERLGRRMAADWPPEGRYTPELYAQDLAARDLFDRQLADCPRAERAALLGAADELDELFLTYTVEDAGAALRAVGLRGAGPRWRRAPVRLPWPVTG